MTSCPCGSGRDLDVCCEPLLKGQPAETVEALTRSRYTAFTQGNLDYIEKTCTKEALADHNRAEVESFLKDTKWRGMEIHKISDGGPDDVEGRVDFSFSLDHKGRDCVQREIASFRKIDGIWYYEHSDLTPKTEPVRVEQVGRNDPCPCGSGKKYKKCCSS